MLYLLHSAHLPWSPWDLRASIAFSTCFVVIVVAAIIWDKVCSIPGRPLNSLCSQRWPPPRFKCWDYRHAPPQLVHAVLGTELPRASTLSSEPHRRPLPSLWTPNISVTATDSLWSYAPCVCFSKPFVPVLQTPPLCWGTDYPNPPPSSPSRRHCQVYSRSHTVPRALAAPSPLLSPRFLTTSICTGWSDYPAKAAFGLLQFQCGHHRDQWQGLWSVITNGSFLW